MQRNISLPELKRRSTLIDKQLALDLAVINNSNNTNNKDNSNKSKTSFSLNSNVSLKDILISNSSSRKVVKG